MLEPVEAGKPAGRLAVAGAPQSDTIALHGVVRTLVSADRQRLLVGSERSATFVTVRGGRWTHGALAPGEAGKFSVIT